MTRSIPANWRERADRIAARGRRMDVFIPGFLLSSPISRLGYWWGCGLGWTWGLLLSRGRVDHRQGLWVFRGMPNWAFGRGGVCVGNCFLTGDVDPTDLVLKHEAVHARQWRHYGLLLPILYALSGYDPLRNRFEIEAGLEDGNYVRRGA
ncbi:Fe-S oxidoreductase [Microbacterium gorillae]|uniref:Fe-S oxidoreductase n=1 Tax=Microbacterium gorillae TaxID=1231063 RepID=UPI0005900DD4|nr:Fe-S oxidoreductase [Microbacterium gorillae]